MIPFSYNSRSLWVRKATTFATAFGIALVVFVLASALMLSEGIKKTLSSSGRADQCIVLRKGSDAELNSSIEIPNIGLIMAASGVQSNAKGVPAGVAEVMVVIALEKLGDYGVTNVQLRGITEESLTFRPTAKVSAGRAPKPGSDEVLIGKALQGRFKGFELEKSFEIRKNRNVKVVGILEDNGSSYESEVWADVDTVRTSFGREGMVSSVRVRLESPSKFEAFKTAIESDKNLGFEALRETDYYEKQSEGVAIFVTALGMTIAFFFSLGASIGAMITMYGSIASRQREIGTLRALGFSRTSILIAFLLESALLALFGGALGALCAVSMKFVKFSMVNFASFSEITFSFEPTPAILLTSLIFACGMGVLGGFLPAVRAARTSPVAAMRG